MLGNAAFEIFEVSQHWERVFLPFFSLPNFGTAVFFCFLVFPSLGKMIFCVFSSSQAWESSCCLFLHFFIFGKGSFCCFLSIRRRLCQLFPNEEITPRMVEQDKLLRVQ